MDIIERIKRWLWLFVELAFVTVLALLLVYLLLGDNAGSYVKSVADNIMKFGAGVPTPSLIGLAIVGLLVWLVARRGS